MTIRVGQATTCTYILPNFKALSRIQPKKLSEEAKSRLRFIDCYRRGNKDGSRRTVVEVCQLFGIPRSLFYKWYNRFDPNDLSTLESRSSRPHAVRTAMYSQAAISLIRADRQDKDSATYSAKKLATIIKKSYPGQPELHLSRATIGRIIKKYRLFFQEKVQAAKQRSKKAIATWKKRKPAGLHSSKDHKSMPRTLIEFDMKHIRIGGKKYYAFCAIDPVTREGLVHVATTSTSRQAQLALQRVIDVYGQDTQLVILNDNGSENLGKAYDYLKNQKITQYFARPYQPKDKPYVERFIGTYQRECLDQWNKEITNLADLDYYTNRWLNNYHYIRPHDNLDDQTPDEFCATLGLTIERRGVSMR